MKIEYVKQFSKQLQRDMEWKIFGHRGKPCLVFPAQDGRFYDYENFGMVEAAKLWIDRGEIQFFCIDSIDLETWSNKSGDPRQRILLHEAWYRYITEEIVPQVMTISTHGNDDLKPTGILTTGCSMGGAHAMNFFLRRPDLFDMVLSLSGIYRADFFFDYYMDDLVYINSPIDYMQNLPLDHPYIEMFQKRKIVMCCGRGEWEEDMMESTRQLEVIFKEKQIPAWVDFWGKDAAHDWVWWKKQLPYFLEKLL